MIEYPVAACVVRYDIHERDGVVLCSDCSMFFEGAVIRIRLGRFLFLRWLELPIHILSTSSD